MKAVTEPALRRELAANLRRLMLYRGLFPESHVGDQCWYLLRQLGGLATEF